MLRERSVVSWIGAWYVVGLACVAVGAGAASARTHVASDGGWYGTLTATYKGNGFVSNGNCKGCYSTSRESATITETITAAGDAKSVGTVSLKETNTYNSQCSGVTTRTEVDTGALHGVEQRGGAYMSVEPYFKPGQYSVGFNPAGIPYKGTISEEKVTTANGKPRCTTATRPSSGVFYIPADTKPATGRGKAITAAQLHGSETYTRNPCGYPRVHCTVKLTWNLHRATKAVPESPGH